MDARFALSLHRLGSSDVTKDGFSPGAVLIPRFCYSEDIDEWIRYA